MVTAAKPPMERKGLPVASQCPFGNLNVLRAWAFRKLYEETVFNKGIEKTMFKISLQGGAMINLISNINTCSK
jgi:hypothetical protein